jgi:hypothetical protein
MENKQAPAESAVELVKSFEDDMKLLAAPTYDTTTCAKFSEGFECILENYRGTFKDMSEYNSSLVKAINDLRAEIQECRQRELHLEKKILKYNQHHPCGFINRRHFDTYLLTTRDRESTDKEWDKFVSDFSYNTDTFALSIYSWIDNNIELKLSK